jgi:acetyl esterase/lipase
MAIDEATAGFLSQLAESGAKPLHEMTPEEARGFTAALPDLFGPGPEVRKAYDEQVATPDGGRITVRVLVPEGEIRALVVYYHGGGWVIGNIEEYDHLTRKLANVLHAAVVNVDYRLAPEHPYPAAFDDCFSVLADVAANAGRYGIDPARIAVSGDSAGGNLAAAVSLAARDRDGPAIAAQALIYPCLTDDLKHASYRVHAETPGLTTASMGSYWNWYLAGAAVPSADPYAVPLKAKNLAGLPRALVHVAEIDPLFDDGRLYAERLKAAGVSTEYRCAKGMIHGFMRARLLGPDSAAEFGAICAFLRRSLI